MINKVILKFLTVKQEIYGVISQILTLSYQKMTIKAVNHANYIIKKDTSNFIDILSLTCNGCNTI